MGEQRQRSVADHADGGFEGGHEHHGIGRYQVLEAQSGLQHRGAVEDARRRAGRRARRAIAPAARLALQVVAEGGRAAVDLPGIAVAGGEIEPGGQIAAPGQQLPGIFAGKAEQLGGHPDRQRFGEIPEQIGLAALQQAVEEFLHQHLDARFPAAHGVGAEGRSEQPAQAGVPRRVVEQHEVVVEARQRLQLLVAEPAGAALADAGGAKASGVGGETAVAQARRNIGIATDPPDRGLVAADRRTGTDQPQQRIGIGDEVGMVGVDVETVAPRSERRTLSVMARLRAAFLAECVVHGPRSAGLA